jgi:hypothetical protein
MLELTIAAGTTRSMAARTTIARAADVLRPPRNFSLRRYMGQVENARMIAQSSGDRNGRSTMKQPTTRRETAAIAAIRSGRLSGVIGFFREMLLNRISL